VRGDNAVIAVALTRREAQCAYSCAMLAESECQKARDRERRNACLPGWAHALSVRAQNCLLRARSYGLVPDLEPETVQALGERWWLKTYSAGLKTVGEIGAAVGGWG
jgi:hypothetical protein